MSKLYGETPDTEVHERDYKMALRVNIHDVLASGYFEKVMLDDVELKSVDSDSVMAYVTDRTKAGVMIRDQNELWLRLKPFYLRNYYTHDWIGRVGNAGVAVEPIMLLKETRGRVQSLEGQLMLNLLERLPKTFVDSAVWVFDDPRRYLLCLNVARNGLTKADKKFAIKSTGKNTIAMTDDQSEGIAMKLRYGGVMYDMNELRGS